MSELTVREYKNKFGLVNKWTNRGNTLIRTEFAYPRETIKKKKKMSHEILFYKDLFKWNDIYEFKVLFFLQFRRQESLIKSKSSSSSN